MQPESWDFSNGVGQGIQESAFYTNLYGPLLPGKLSLQGCTLLRKVSVAAVAINCDLLQLYVYDYKSNTASL